MAAYAFAWIEVPGRTGCSSSCSRCRSCRCRWRSCRCCRLFSQLAAAGAGVAARRDPDHPGQNYPQVWIAHTIFALPLAIFLLHNFISEIPGEVIEAARVDGASHGQIFFRIVLPLAMPAIASFAIFQFLWVWNDLLVALIFAGRHTGCRAADAAARRDHRQPRPGLAPADRGRVRLDRRAADRVLRAAALLRARPAGRLDEGLTSHLAGRRPRHPHGAGAIRMPGLSLEAKRQVPAGGDR